jgi:hypothetical protein
MKTLMFLASLLVLTPTNMVIDFKQESKDWYALNDGVMGGLSQGAIQYKDDKLLFEGNVSLENNGGFASVRNSWGSYDLSSYNEVTIRYRNKGQSFAMTMENLRQWYRPNFKITLPSSEKWTKKTFKISEFRAHQVGRPLDYYLDKELASTVKRLGFITNDKKASNFSLEIDYIIFQ